MIEKIEIDGFRSLIGFKISLQKGLNILVGPNGTGKSNFISFLDFISALMEEDLNSAIAVAQGAGAVFSKEKFSDDEATLSFHVKGSWNAENNAEQHFFFVEDDGSRKGKYHYKCVLKYLRAIPAVYISYEEIFVTGNKSPDFKAVRTTRRDEKTFKTSVEADDPDGKLVSKFKYYMSQTESQSLDESLSKSVASEASILRYMQHASIGLAHVIEDLMSYKSVNIDPTVARKSTPVGSTIQLMPNGEGLAGTLYHIKRGSYYPGSSKKIRYRSVDLESIPSFESILSWCREVNSNIHSFDVALEFMEAQLIPSMKFEFGNRTEDFSFARISDGTVKWLALTTIILAESGLNMIEEPENFLHPLMQETFVSLCRDVLRTKPNRTIVISTHSPTLLDCCKPTELTMFELHNGQTRATGVANRSELEDKIRKSRFQLGHYYKIGALYGEDSSSS